MNSVSLDITTLGIFLGEHLQNARIIGSMTRTVFSKMALTFAAYPSLSASISI
jgi:hypothetical protein